MVVGTNDIWYTFLLAQSCLKHPLDGNNIRHKIAQVLITFDLIKQSHSSWQKRPSVSLFRAMW